MNRPYVQLCAAMLAALVAASPATRAKDHGPGENPRQAGAPPRIRFHTHGLRHNALDTAE